MQQLKREIEIMIVTAVGELHDQFIEKLSETINFIPQPPQSNSLLSFFKPRKDNLDKKIKNEMTIAYFCLLKAKLEELFDAGVILAIGRERVEEISCLLTVSLIGTSAAESKEILLLIQERIDSTYVVFSYGEPFQNDEKKRIRLRCLGDVLLGIDNRLGPRTRLMKRLDEFHENWKFGGDLKFLSDLAS